MTDDDMIRRGDAKRIARIAAHPIGSRENWSEMGAGRARAIDLACDAIDTIPAVDVGVKPSPDVDALVGAKLQAADAYANEITPNGGRRIDNITGLLSDKQADHITTQIDLAFKAGWQAALARLKGGAT